MEVNGQHNAPAAAPRGKNHGTHGVGASMGPRDGLDVVERSILLLIGFEPQTIKPLALSVYVLSNPDSQRNKGRENERKRTKMYLS